MAHLLRLAECFLLTAGIRQLRLQASPSPPSSAQWISPLRLDLLRLASLELPPELLGACSGSSSPCRLDGSLQPRRRLQCCARPLGREHDVAPLPSQPLDGGLSATTMAAPSCRRHGLLPCSLVSPPVSFFSSPCFCVLAMVA
jgi:hypothetical protein